MNPETKRSDRLSQDGPNHESKRSLWLLGKLWSQRSTQALIATVCVVCFAGILAPWESLFELAIHCRLHLLVASCILLPCAWFCGNRWLALPLLCSLGLCASSVQPWALWTSSTEANDELTTEFSVLSWNVLASNRAREEAANFLKQADPDVLVLIEPQPNFTDGMDFLTERYPHSFSITGWSGGGLNVYSKLSDTSFRAEEFGYKFQPAVVATVPNERGGKLELVAIHTLSPLPRYRAAIREQQLEQLGNWAARSQVPVVACGDMNITPWAGGFRKLIQGGFKDSRMGAGNCPSWPSSLGVLGIPIDHALYQGECQIFNREVLAEAPGSDHRPISFHVRF